MNKYKKCSNCSRMYAGEGYLDLCTEDCFFKQEYAKKYNKKSNRTRGSERIIPYDFKSDKDINSIIKQKNQNWCEKKEKTIDTEKIRKSGKKLERSKLFKPIWTGKQYNSVRG